MYKIGVVARPDTSKSGNRIHIIYDDIVKAIMKYNSEPLIVINPQKLFPGKISKDILKKQLASCDGFILQGGDDFNTFDLQILDYCYKQNVPTLGICLGMQTMGIYMGNKLGSITSNINHLQKGKKYVHLVTIKEDSKFYSVIKNTLIKVNSRHKQCLIYNDEHVCAKASDNTIEAIEDAQLSFFIGVQWHPESMIEYDNVSKRLFEEFFKEVGKYCANKEIVRSYNNTGNI